MNLSELAEIEARVTQLPVGEQLWLLERLVHHLRHQAFPDPTQEQHREHQLAAMAADPAIRTELEQIEEEFSVTEADGLARI